MLPSYFFSKIHSYIFLRNFSPRNSSTIQSRCDPSLQLFLQKQRFREKLISWFGNNVRARYVKTFHFYIEHNSSCANTLI